MSGIDVSYGENGRTLVVWFANRYREHHREKTASGVILKKDVDGHVIGVEYQDYFDATASVTSPDDASPVAT